MLRQSQQVPTLEHTGWCKSVGTGAAHLGVASGPRGVAKTRSQVLICHLPLERQMADLRLHQQGIPNSWSSAFR